jgi:hypothetical protein
MNPWVRITAGIILTFGGALLVSGCGASAFAAPQGVDNQGKFTLAVGGSEASKYDMLWVLHEHAPHPMLKPERGIDGELTEANRITLCLYKIEKDGEKMKLVAARNIAYDLELQDMGQLSPKVNEIYGVLKRRLK